MRGRPPLEKCAVSVVGIESASVMIDCAQDLCRHQPEVRRCELRDPGEGGKEAHLELAERERDDLRVGHVVRVVVVDVDVQLGRERARGVGVARIGDCARVVVLVRSCSPVDRCEGGRGATHRQSPSR